MSEPSNNNPKNSNKSGFVWPEDDDPSPPGSDNVTATTATTASEQEEHQSQLQQQPQSQPAVAEDQPLLGMAQQQQQLLLQQQRQLLQLQQFPGAAAATATTNPLLLQGQGLLPSSMYHYGVPLANYGLQQQLLSPQIYPPSYLLAGGGGFGTSLYPAVGAAGLYQYPSALTTPLQQEQQLLLQQQLLQKQQALLQPQAPGQVSLNNLSRSSPHSFSSTGDVAHAEATTAQGGKKSDAPATITTTKPVSASAAPAEPYVAKSKPKRPLSAYNLFFKDQREAILASIPDKDDGVGNDGDDNDEAVADSDGKKRSKTKRNNSKKAHGKISFEEMAKMISKKWKEVDPKIKSTYQAKADKEKVRYGVLKEEYMESQQRGVEQRHERLNATVDEQTMKRYLESAGSKSSAKKRKNKKA